MGFGSGISSVVYSYLLKKESSERQIGCVLGINSALQNVALATGTILSGFLVMTFGAQEVYIGLAVTTFLLAVLSFLSLQSYR
ncbi:MAG: hypothetical protein JW855_01360 [Gammaproteobacteria bacterium]|nr:hypothetical protein [Gammaproteobacteria bacterium]